MKTFKKLALFFICNWLGFSMPAFIYLATLKFNIIDYEAEDFDALNFYSSMAGDNPTPVIISEPSITWLVCALFSFSIFFVKSKRRTFFLIAPIIFPTVHSLILLFNFM